VKIVVGIDGSETSNGALRWAVDEARLRQAKVMAVHAWVAPVPPLTFVQPAHPDFVELVTGLSDGAEKLVEGAVERVVGNDSSVDVDAVATEGPAATVLLDAASDADLLVVGSRGHGGFVGLLLGSVSRQCVDHAPCPVLVHRKREPRS
jgi:nucleotide-binding universal stress UspA family protein